MKRLTPEDHVQNYFMTAAPEACAIMLDKVQLIMRVRAIPGPAPKLGRPRKKREAPPNWQLADQSVPKGEGEAK
jgi:hypothetical protein